MNPQGKHLSLYHRGQYPAAKESKGLIDDYRRKKMNRMANLKSTMKKFRLCDGKEQLEQRRRFVVLNNIITAARFCSG